MKGKRPRPSGSSAHDISHSAIPVRIGIEPKKLQVERLLILSGAGPAGVLRPERPSPLPVIPTQLGIRCNQSCRSLAVMLPIFAASTSTTGPRNASARKRFGSACVAASGSSTAVSFALSSLRVTSHDGRTSPSGVMRSNNGLVALSAIPSPASIRRAAISVSMISRSKFLSTGMKRWPLCTGCAQARCAA